MIIKQLRYCKRYYFSFLFKNIFVFFYKRDKVGFPYTGSYNLALCGLQTFSFWKWYCLDIAQRYVKVNLTHIKGFVRFNFQVCRVLLELRLVLWVSTKFYHNAFQAKKIKYIVTPDYLLLQKQWDVPWVIYPWRSPTEWVLQYVQPEKRHILGCEKVDPSQQNKSENWRQPLE